MSKEIATNLGRGLPQWSIFLRANGQAKVVEALKDDKLKGLAALERLGLPRYRTLITPAMRFLEAPEEAFSQLDLERYLVVLNPHYSSLERKRIFGLSREDVVLFTKQSLAESDIANYDVILQESFMHCYGGNIVCSRSGGVFVEVVRGELGHNALVTSRENPQYVVERDPLTRLFRSKHVNEQAVMEPDLPEAVWRAIMSVPHAFEGEHAPGFETRGLKFVPGYYELPRPSLGRRPFRAILYRLFRPGALYYLSNRSLAYKNCVQYF